MGTRAVGFVGASESGKTTLIGRLIGYLRATGRRIGVIKHTHHAIGDPARGDTERFLDAGATIAVLCDDREFLLLARSSDARTVVTHRGSFTLPTELLEGMDLDLVLVEGFKQFDGWPRILVQREGSESGLVDRASVVAVVGAGPVKGEVHFDVDDVEGIAAFVDRIAR